MQFFDADATRDALPFERLIPALRAQFARGAVVPPRHVHAVGEGLTSLLMPAWEAGGAHYGVKVVNVAPGNAARGLPGVHGSYLLHDAATGVARALIDGSELTARRTAAASALAASWLARADAEHLLVVGAGRIAALLPAAYRVVRPAIRRVSVWARAHDKARTLAAQLVAQGFDAHAPERLDDAVAAAHIVSCATMATAPLVQGRWLQPGSHLDLIGGYTPAMREADDDCFAGGAGLWVDTDEALQKSGDLLGPLARGVFAAADLRGTLEQLARGSAPGRQRADERTVFKSVGTALEDLAAAVLVAGGARGA
jgi:ornithine cyclodeaminase/alanine dehydrogenase-like protein (mu-crystallin family)